MVFVVIGLLVFFFAVYMLSCLINIIVKVCDATPILYKKCLKKWFQSRKTAVLIYPVQNAVVIENYDRVIDIYPTIIPDAIIVSVN
jgi:hypothetical protein